MRDVIDIAETKQDDQTTEMLEQDGGEQQGAKHG